MSLRCRVSDIYYQSVRQMEFHWVCREGNELRIPQPMRKLHTTGKVNERILLVVLVKQTTGSLNDQ